MTNTASLLKRNYVKRRALNGGKPLTVDPSLARRHIDGLRQGGMGLRPIAKQADLHWTVVQDIVAGRRARIFQRTHDALMAVECVPAGGSVVPALATRRRLQALGALGWTFTTIADQMGYYPTYLRSLVNGERPAVTIATERNIAELYERLSSNKPKPIVPIDRAMVTRQLRKAKRNGWAPPAAWDDEDLYDPKAKPKGVRAA